MSTDREVIEHGVEIKHIQTDVDTLMEDMDELKKRLDAIENTLNEIKGGWKVFIFIAIATVGSMIVSWVVNHWLK